MPATKSEALERIDRAREELENEWNQYLTAFPEDAIDAVNEQGRHFKILGFGQDEISTEQST